MNKRLRISPVSKRRRGQMKAYGELIRQMDSLPPFFCWFCGKEISYDPNKPVNIISNAPPDHHHISGRDGEFYLAKNNLVHVHRSCHNDYHFASLSVLLNTEWYVEWLNKRAIPEIKTKELNKFDKNNLNPDDYGIRNI